MRASFSAGVSGRVAKVHVGLETVPAGVVFSTRHQKLEPFWMTFAGACHVMRELLEGRMYPLTLEGLDVVPFHAGESLRWRLKA